jgi:hypothetical protein
LRPAMMHLGFTLTGKQRNVNLTHGSCLRRDAVNT